MESDQICFTGEKAENYFTSGFFCAESVVLALAEAQGIQNELLPKAATAFCSGMARSCGMCGALTGAIMGLGIGFGRSGAEENVETIYTMTQEMISSFKQEFGFLECHKLLGCDIGTSEGQAYFKEHNLASRCTGYTKKAAEIATALLINQQNNLSE